MSDGEVAWSWPPDAEVKLADVRQCIAGDGGNKARSPGRARINRKPIAQGGPGVFGQTCGTCRLHFFPQAGHGRGQRPAFPAPSISGEGGAAAELGRKSRREADDAHLCMACGPEASPKIMSGKNALVLPDRIELSTSPLPRECSTTELRQQRDWRGQARRPRPNAGGSCHKVPACASAARPVFGERRQRDASKGSERPPNRSEIARSRRILAVGRPWRPQCPGHAGNSPSGRATAGRAEPSVCVANASWLSHLRPQLCLWYGVTGGRDDG